MNLLSKMQAVVRVSQMAEMRRRRKEWLQIHLYLGLIMGAVLVVIGITGSILVFWRELDTLLNAELMTVKTSSNAIAEYKSLDEIVTAAEGKTPLDSKLAFIFYPPHEQAVFNISYWLPSAAISNAVDEYNIFVNPYTAEVTGIRLWQKSDSVLSGALLSIIFRLHDALLLNATGILMVGVFGVLLIFSTLTGIIVWWPLNGNYKQAMTIELFL